MRRHWYGGRVKYGTLLKVGQQPTEVSLRVSKRIYLAVEKLGINNAKNCCTCSVRSKYDFLDIILTMNAPVRKYCFYIVVVLLYTGITPNSCYESSY